MDSYDKNNDDGKEYAQDQADGNNRAENDGYDDTDTL